MTITVVYSRTHPDVSSLTGHTGSHLWFSRFSFLHLWFFSYFVIFILSFIFQLFTTFGFLSLQLSSLFLSSCANVFILFLCFQLSYLSVSFYIHLSFSLGFRLLFWAERISFCFYFYTSCYLYFWFCLSKEKIALVCTIYSCISHIYPSFLIPLSLERFSSVCYVTIAIFSSNYLTIALAHLLRISTVWHTFSIIPFYFLQLA